MSITDTSQTIFAMVVHSTKDQKRAELLIDSLRTFGGVLKDCPVWIFDSSPHPGPLPKGEGDVDLSLKAERVDVFPLDVPQTMQHTLFAAKVLACAQAEAMAKEHIRSLVCIDTGVLVVNPPVLFDLEQDFDLAVRPVHIKNVGLEAGTPVDGFWSGIYAALGVQDIQHSVETFIGQQRIRAYFNSHAFAINPSLGLLQSWWDHFQKLALDQPFQKAYCHDELHQIFLFQALLSALLVTKLDWRRIRILPAPYNYPYNLQSRVPVEQRAGALNDVVCVAYEERSLNPQKMDDIRVEPPLRDWLIKRMSVA